MKTVKPCAVEGCSYYAFRGPHKQWCEWHGKEADLYRDKVLAVLGVGLDQLPGEEAQWVREAIEDRRVRRYHHVTCARSIAGALKMGPSVL